jgi:hypothetical protein
MPGNCSPRRSRRASSRRIKAYFCSAEWNDHPVTEGNEPTPSPAVILRQSRVSSIPEHWCSIIEVLEE